jgi:hypothetical protein
MNKELLIKMYEDKLKINLNEVDQQVIADLFRNDEKSEEEWKGEIDKESNNNRLAQLVFFHPKGQVRVDALKKLSMDSYDFANYFLLKDDPTPSEDEGVFSPSKWNGDIKKQILEYNSNKNNEVVTKDVLRSLAVDIGGWLGYSALEQLERNLPLEDIQAIIKLMLFKKENIYYYNELIGKTTNIPFLIALLNHYEQFMRELDEHGWLDLHLAVPISIIMRLLKLGEIEFVKKFITLPVYEEITSRNYNEVNYAELGHIPDFFYEHPIYTHIFESYVSVLTVVINELEGDVDFLEEVAKSKKNKFCAIYVINKINSIKALNRIYDYRKNLNERDDHPEILRYLQWRISNFGNEEDVIKEIVNSKMNEPPEEIDLNDSEVHWV